MFGAITFSSHVYFHYLTNSQIVKGALATIWLTAASLAVGVIAGAFLNLLANSPLKILQWIYHFYVFVIRATPLLVILVLVYEGLPEAGITLSVTLSAIVGLSLNESAYLAEIIRGGVLAVPHGQIEAAEAVGLSRFQSMRYVVLPQAIRSAIPPTGNEVNGLLKSTSLVSIISMTELFRAVQDIYNANFRVLELLLVATTYYLVLACLWRIIQSWLEQRCAIPPVHRSRLRFRRPVAVEPVGTTP